MVSGRFRGVFSENRFSFLQQLRSQGVRCENSLADSEEEAKIYARIQKIPKLYIVGEQMEEITIGEEPV